MVIGGTVVDITATAHEASSMLNSSFPGTARISLGGVGRNVAEGICKLHANGCVFVSAVGGERKHQDSTAVAAGDATDDLFGSWLVGEIERKGIVSATLFFSRIIMALHRVQARVTDQDCPSRAISFLSSSIS
jgi:hypothetical protein